MSNTHIYFIAYDISCPKRWRQMQKALRKLCERCQLSVFLCRATPARAKKLERQLQHIIIPGEDKLLFLDLGPPVKAERVLSSSSNILEIINLEPEILQ